MRTRGQAWSALSLTVLFAALGVVLAKDALTRVRPFTFAWLQVGLGMLILPLAKPLLRARVDDPPARAMPARTWRLLVTLGLCNFTIARAAFLIALDTVPATTHSYVVNLTALVTMAMSVVFLRERPSRLQVVGALIAVAGIRLFFAELPTPAETAGLYWLALGVLALATTNTAARVLASSSATPLSTYRISSISLLIGGAPLVLAGLSWTCARGEFAVVASIRGADWAVLLLNATTSIAVGPFVFNAAFRVLRSYEASVLATSGLIYTALLAMALLGEPVGTLRWLAIALMLGGIACAQVRPRRPAADPTPT